MHRPRRGQGAEVLAWGRLLAVQREWIISRKVVSQRCCRGPRVHPLRASDASRCRNRMASCAMHRPHTTCHSFHADKREPWACKSHCSRHTSTYPECISFPPRLRLSSPPADASKVGWRQNSRCQRSGVQSQSLLQRSMAWVLPKHIRLTSIFQQHK